MRILTLENETFLLNKLPEHVSDDMCFSVLDNSNPKEPDFFFIPLIYIESFSSPAVVLDIGGNELIMPLLGYVFINLVFFFFLQNSFHKNSLLTQKLS